MAGLHEVISSWSEGSPIWIVLAVALLLGLRHATDPDHLVAVSALVATVPERAARRAWSLGLAWGAGHATTLIVLGTPVVLAGSHLPAPVQTAAETLVGVIIMVLALRLLLRWKRGGFHVHEHEHDGVTHRHLHSHEHAHHSHGHEHTLTHSGSQAFGIGLAHGIGGSAGIAVLLLATIESRADALLALGVFAIGAVVSMAVLSMSLGFALGRRPVRARLHRAMPVLGTASFVFGAWYALGALGG